MDDGMTSQYSPEQLKQLVEAGGNADQMSALQTQLAQIAALQQGQHHSFLGGLLPGVAQGLGGQKQDMLRQSMIAKLLGGAGGAGAGAGAGDAGIAGMMGDFPLAAAAA